MSLNTTNTPRKFNNSGDRVDEVALDSAAQCKIIQRTPSSAMSSNYAHDNLYRVQFYEWPNERAVNRSATLACGVLCHIPSRKSVYDELQMQARYFCPSSRHEFEFILRFCLFLFPFLGILVLNIASDYLTSINSGLHFRSIYTPKQKSGSCLILHRLCSVWCVEICPLLAHSLMTIRLSDWLNDFGLVLAQHKFETETDRCHHRYHTQ